MPAPSSINEFLELVQKSGVVDERKLTAYLEKLRTSSTMPSDPGKLAGVMVRDGILTQFQAEQVLQGKWRRFNIGKYKVLERLGSGGMGSVYLCEHKLMRRRVAVKVLPAAKAEDSSSLERFYREARAVAALDHPNIVRAYDIDQDEKLHFLVMEYVDGASLQEMVKKAGPLSPLRAAHYIRQAAFGLQHAFEAAGLVHRDIKPGNILVDRNGIVKVLDMGLARFFHDEDDILTKKYDENVLGTADYLAPEQALDSHSVDIRADIYSLGGTFYFCLTGRTPFSEGTVAQKLIWHQTRQPKPVKTVRTDVPDGLVAVLEKMMAKAPGDRYQTPREAADALAPWTQTPIPPPSEAEMPRLSLAAVGSPASIDGQPRAPAAPGSGSGSHPSRSWQVTTPVPPAPPTPANPAGKAGTLPPSTARQGPTSAPPTTPSVRPAVRPNPPHVSGPPAQRPAAPPVPPAARNGQMTAPAQQDVEEEAPAWEQLTPDTDNPLGRHDTAPRSSRSARRSGPSSRGLGKKAGGSSLFLWLLIMGCLALVGAGVAAAYFGGLLGRSGQGTNDENVLVVNSRKATEKPDDRTFKTINEALRRATGGQRIVVEDEMVEEFLILDNPSSRMGKQITIEAPSGKTLTWRAPGTIPLGGWFVKLNGVNDLKLRRITFDGRDKIDDLMLLTGKCPGLTLDEVTVTGFKKNGIRITNCAGAINQNVTLQNVRIVAAIPAETGLWFEVNPTVNPPKNEYITLRDCRWDGEFKDFVRVTGAAPDAVDLEGENVYTPRTGNPVRLEKLPNPAPAAPK